MKNNKIKKATEIGRKGCNLYIWAACMDCGKERWVQCIKGEPVCKRCHSCATKTVEYRNKQSKNSKGRTMSEKTRAAMSKARVGSNNPAWVGGRIRQYDYIMIRLRPESFYYPMVKKSGYIFEHRLVMAQSLGRCLQPFEHVHHKNGIRDDNRIENLELTTKDNHSRDHSKGYHDGYLKGLRDGRLKQVRELKNKIRDLEILLNGTIPSPDDVEL